MDQHVPSGIPVSPLISSFSLRQVYSGPTRNDIVFSSKVLTATRNRWWFRKIVLFSSILYDPNVLVSSRGNVSSRGIGPNSKFCSSVTLLSKRESKVFGRPYLWKYPLCPQSRPSKFEWGHWGWLRMRVVYHLHFVRECEPWWWREKMGARIKTRLVLIDYQWVTIVRALGSYPRAEADPA